MLKRSMVLIVFSLIFCVSINAATQIEVDTKPVSVKVFTRGAELFHTAKIKVLPGVQEIVFTNLPANIDQNSIQISADGKGIVMSVVQRTNYLKANEKTAEIISLEDSLKTYKYLLGKNENNKQVLNDEIDMLLANKVLSGREKSVTVAELKSFESYYKQQLTSLRNEILDVDLKIEQAQKNVDRIENQLNELNKMRSMPVNEIVVTVSAKKSETMNLKLSYYIYSAGWSPRYDIRVTDINQPSQLYYNANVWQSSGIDWNDAKIILSTRNAQQSGTKPELYPWFIDFEIEYMQYRDAIGAKKEMLRKTMDVAAAAPEIAEAESMADYISINENQLAVEFVPELKYSIPSDGKPHIISLHEYKLPATYEYYCVPKLNEAAYLVAYLTDWNEYNLLPGQANIYFENSFVGKTTIDPYSVNDTLAASLGRDENIIVKREKLKDFTEDKFLSSDVERFFGYEISIRNNKKSQIKILVEDQIPISQNEDIEVALIDKSGALYEKSTGMLQWKLNIEPTKTEQKKLVYSVRYAKDKIINGL